jgi:hypothetical protein
MVDDNGKEGEVNVGFWVAANKWQTIFAERLLEHDSDLLRFPCSLSDYNPATLAVEVDPLALIRTVCEMQTAQRAIYELMIQQHVGKSKEEIKELQDSMAALGEEGIHQLGVEHFGEDDAKLIELHKLNIENAFFWSEVTEDVYFALHNLPAFMQFAARMLFVIGGTMRSARWMGQDGDPNSQRDMARQSEQFVEGFRVLVQNIVGQARGRKQRVVPRDGTPLVLKTWDVLCRLVGDTLPSAGEVMDQVKLEAPELLESRRKSSLKSKRGPKNKKILRAREIDNFCKRLARDNYPFKQMLATLKA